MSRATTVGDAPPEHLKFQRRLRFGPAMKELWQARELMRSLAERSLRARYKQAFLGLAWVILTPIALMIVFTLVFRRVVDIPTGGVPYAVFSYVGLIPWSYFSTCVSIGGQSILLNNSLINKVYCPREVFPLSSGIVAVVDALVQVLILVLLFLITGFAPKVTSYWIPLLLVVQLMFAMGITLVVAAVVVYLRDLRHVLPLILQLGLFATPVAWGIDKFIPERFQVLYSAVNPLGPVIDGYRRTMLFGQAPDWGLVVPGAVSAFIVLVAGYTIFKKLETRFADVA